MKRFFVFVFFRYCASKIYYEDSLYARLEEDYIIRSNILVQNRSKPSTPHEVVCSDPFKRIKIQ